MSRKKLNPADELYISSFAGSKSIAEISQELDLSEALIKEIYDKTNKANRLGASKITLKNGQKVYQMTADIDKEPAPTQPTQASDEHRGIYRSE